MAEHDDFSSEPPTAVTLYVRLATEALLWQAEFERRAAEMEQPVVSARGTREWVRK